MYSTIVLQNGPIGEVGVNGDQVDDLIGFCSDKLEEFNENVPDVHTSLAIGLLKIAHDALAIRTAERRARGVEGTSQA